MVNTVASVFIGLVLLIGSGVVIWMLWINAGSGKINELLFPTLGAFLIAIYFGYKEVWVNRPEPLIRTKSSMALFEYETGNPLAVMNLFAGHANELRTSIKYVEFICAWRKRFTEDRTPDFLNTLLANDIDFHTHEFVEWFMLDSLATTFHLGWNMDPNGSSYLPYLGSRNATSYGAPREFSERISLKKLFTPGQNRIVDSLAASALEMTVPKGTVAKLESGPRETKLTFINERFKFTLTMSMPPRFKPTDTSSLDMPLLHALEAKLRPYNPDKTFEDFRIRYVHFGTLFEQSIWRRFSEQADHDVLFAKNVGTFIEESYGWSHNGPVIEALSR